MKRRTLLAGVGGAVLSGVAGCVGLGSGGGKGTPTSDRPLVDETFAAGPMDPPCVSSGKPHFPPMIRREELINAVPDSTDPDAVAQFVRERTGITSSIELREERYARVGFRGNTENVTERYSSEQHYVGEVSGASGRHALLVVYHHGYTQVVHFETSANC